MPAPNLRTVRRSRSQSVETASGVFMVSPEAADDRQEFSPSRSQIAKKVTRSFGPSAALRLRYVETGFAGHAAATASLKTNIRGGRQQPISPPKPCWYKPPAAPPRPQAPYSQPCSSPQPLTRIAPPLLAQLVALDLAGRRARQIVGNFEPPRPLVRRQRPRQPFACGRHRRRAVSAGRRNDIEHDLREPDFAFAACLPRPGRRPRSSPR